MIEKVFQAFEDLGFKIQQYNNNVYGLSYDKIKLVYRFYPDDQYYIDLGMQLAEVSDLGETAAYDTANQLNMHLKFVKSYVCSGKLWAVCERNIESMKTVQNEIKFMVHCMLNAMRFYYELHEKSDDNQEEEN